MRYKTALISVLAFGLLFGLGAGNRTDRVEVATATENTRANLQQIQEDKKYYGEALNMSEKNGKIPVYSEANRGSATLKVLKDRDRVEVLGVVPYGWLKVKLEDGSEGYAESKMVRMEELPPHKYGVREEGHTIHYSEEEQMLTLYRDGEVVLESKGSAGIGDQFTPKGVFKIDKNHSGEEAYVSDFGQGYRYYISFYEAEYLVHSVPFSKEGYVIPEENRKLGSPASHGCIRLPIPVAKYLYDNVEEGALVIIE